MCACKNVTEFCAAFDYALRRVKKGKNFYLNQVYNEFMKEQEICEKAMKKNNPKFENLMAAANHYDKHKDFGKKDPLSLSREEYFAMASEMTSQPLTKENSKLTQEGDSIMIKNIDPRNGAVTIAYLKTGVLNVATLYYNKKLVDKQSVCENNQIEALSKFQGN